MNSAGTLKVSKKSSAAFSLFLLGLRGASVSNTGCCNADKVVVKAVSSTLCDFTGHTDTYHIYINDSKANCTMNNTKCSTR